MLWKISVKSSFQVIKCLLTGFSPFSMVCSPEQPTSQFSRAGTTPAELLQCGVRCCHNKHFGLPVKMRRNVIMGLLNSFSSGPHWTLNKKIFKGVKRTSECPQNQAAVDLQLVSALHPGIPKVDRDILISPHLIWIWSWEKHGRREKIKLHPGLYKI